MIRLLYVTSTLQRSGPTRQLYNLIKYLDRARYEPHLVTLSPELSDSMWKDFQEIGVYLSTLDMSRLEGIFFAEKGMRNAINVIRPDIIHTQGIRADSVLSDIKTEIPWVLTSHNYPREDYVLKFGKVRGRIMSWKHMDVMRKCRHVVACSTSMSDLLRKHGVKSKSIQNGVEMLAAEFDSVEPLENLKRPVFLSVGSLIPRKNMRFLMEAFRQYRETSEGSLIILGDGPQMHELSVYADDDVYLLGKVSNVADYLALGDYFVSASYSEGLPNAALEALSSGLPVLLSDIPSHLEIAQACTGACKIYSLAEGPSFLAMLMANIERAFESDAKAQALKVANNQFSAKVMSNKYQEVYSELLEKCVDDYGSENDII